MNFVVELSEFMGFDAVMAVVDSVSKTIYFIYTHTTVSAKEAAKLFLYNMWKLHDLSICVVSD